MKTVVEVTPEIDIQALLDEVINLKVHVTEYKHEIVRLNEMIRLMQINKYGRKADQVDYDELQLQLPNLFNEAESLTATMPEVDEAETIPEHTRRKCGGRRKLPENLLRETVVHDLPEEKKLCDGCGHTMKQIGMDSTEKLEYQPATLKVMVHERPKYGCPECECAPKQAKPEPQPIPKSMATSSLLAYILISKFIDATPLFRQEKQWRRLGIDLGRALLSSWVVKCGDLLQVLWDLMQEDLRQSDFVQADETTLQVLKEKGRSAAQKSYMWLFQCGPPDKRIILYHYAPTRAGAVATDFLGRHYRGYLQTDGYSGYHVMCAYEDVIGVACMAHIRRKFADAAKLHKGKPGLAHEAVAIIKRLYAIERYAKEQKMTPEQRYELRQEKSKPIMNAFKQWLDQHQPEVPPSLKTGQAFTYAQNEWERMTHFLDDGRIDIDNNAAERSIKPFVIGRKNWLFCNTANGARASAVIYSLLQSASANDLPLLSWLTFVLKELPRCTTDDERRSLLPHRFDVSRLKLG